MNSLINTRTPTVTIITTTIIRATNMVTATFRKARSP